MSNNIEPVEANSEKRENCLSAAWQQYAEYLSQYPVEGKKPITDVGVQLYFETLHNIITDMWKQFRECLHKIEVQKQKELKVHEVRSLSEAAQRIEGLRRTQVLARPLPNNTPIFVVGV